MTPLTPSTIRVALRPLAVCLAVALGLGGPQISVARAGLHRAPSGTFAVTNCDDSGSGSLRDAMLHAPDDSLIDLTGLACSTITLSSGAVNTLVDDIDIVGPGSGRLAIVGNGVDRVIGHGGDGLIDLSGMTLRNGAVPNSAGGCLYSAGSVRMYDLVVSGCRTYSTAAYTVVGGGVYARGDLQLTYSTISDNLVTAPGGHAYGGGAFVHGYLFMQSSTISDNTASGLVGNTGGIAAAGNVNIAYSTISGNQAQFNAALGLFSGYATHALSIRSTTISGNAASIEDGGVGVLHDIDIQNCTITDNHDEGGAAAAGGLFLGTGITANIDSSIIAGNTTGTSASDIAGYSGASIEGSGNLVIASTLPLPFDTLYTDPLLGPLADNGGPTRTHALLGGSPAIGGGDNRCGCEYDQRGGGFARDVGSGPDIGAFEIQSSGATRTVANCNDTGSGSLRDAVANVVSGDVIDLSSLACGTITLTSGAIEINQGNVAVQGPGPGSLTIDAGGKSRVFYHDRPGTLTISGVTLANGYDLESAFAQGGCVVDFGSLALDRVDVTACRAASTGDTALGGAVYAFHLDMNRSTISGSTAGSTSSIAYGGGLFARTLTMQDSVVADNAAYAGNGHQSFGGGLIAVYASSITRSTISANQAGLFAGALLFYDATVADSTISGNTAFSAFGGIGSYGFLALYNSTVAFNTSANGAGGVELEGPAQLQGTIMFGNTSGGMPFDVGASGASPSGSHNLVGATDVLLPPDTLHGDPHLGPLQDNGGSTPTHALAADSIAIDAGNNLLDLDDDQRGSGFARVVGAAADIGAYELQPDTDTIFRNGFEGS